MADQTNTVAEVAAEQANAADAPHPLQPLENHLNGSVHNASGAIRALEAWFAKEIAKIRAEFSAKDDE